MIYGEPKGFIRFWEDYYLWWPFRSRWLHDTCLENIVYILRGKLTILVPWEARVLPNDLASWLRSILYSVAPIFPNRLPHNAAFLIGTPIFSITIALLRPPRVYNRQTWSYGHQSVFICPVQVQKGFLIDFVLLFGCRTHYQLRQSTSEGEGFRKDFLLK